MSIGLMTAGTALVFIGLYLRWLPRRSRRADLRACGRRSSRRPEFATWIPYASSNDNYNNSPCAVHLPYRLGQFFR